MIIFTVFLQNFKMSKIPRPSELPRPTANVSAAAASSLACDKMQEQITKHKQKMQAGQVRAQYGTMANKRHGDKLRNAPRQISPAEVRQREAGYDAVLQSAKNVGELKCSKARAIPQSSCEFQKINLFSIFHDSNDICSCGHRGRRSIAAG